MSDFASRFEKCERAIEQLRGELDALRSEMIEVVGGVLARVDEVLAKVELAIGRCSRIFERRLRRASRACGHASTRPLGPSARVMSQRN